MDLYEPHLLFMSCGILLLCGLDAHFTLLFLAEGARELNVVMDVLIRRSDLLFVVVKYILTSAGLLFIITHKNFYIFRTVRVGHLIYLVLTIYLVLILYELSLWPHVRMAWL